MNAARSRRRIFEFQLYVAGDAPNSRQAVVNLNALCATHLPDRCKIEVIDVFRHPRRALAEHIFMTPTLVKRAPLPVRRIVGALSQTEVVLQALGLEEVSV